MALKAGEAVPVSELTARLPEFRWRELFRTIRALKRQGAVHVHRHRSEFFVSLLQFAAGPASASSDNRTR
jgi:hypothetical protein